MKIETEPT